MRCRDYPDGPNVSWGSYKKETGASESEIRDAILLDFKMEEGVTRQEMQAGNRFCPRTSRRNAASQHLAFRLVKLSSDFQPPEL
jgi:hypothetical protein